MRSVKTLDTFRLKERKNTGIAFHLNQLNNISFTHVNVKREPPYRTEQQQPRIEITIQPKDDAIKESSITTQDFCCLK